MPLIEARSVLILIALITAATPYESVVDPTFYGRMFHKYLDLEDMYAYLNTIASDHPDRVQLQSIGESHEGRDLLLAKVGRYDGSGKPSIWIDGAMHGREWVSPSVCLFIVDTLVKNYSTDPNIARYVNNINWHILPVMNPDGYDYSRTVTEEGFRSRFDWRKNRRPPSCSEASACCHGVDLNRNFGYQWGGTHSTNDSCREEYRGSEPFSEPESRAVRDYVLKHSKSMKAFFTLHSFGQLWLYPFGYDTSTYPDNQRDIDTVASKATKALKAVHGVSYKVGSVADVYYPSSGTSGDWAKGVANISYVYAVELRPARYTIAGFIGHSNKVYQTSEETWAGIRVVADEILSKWSV